MILVSAQVPLVLGLGLRVWGLGLTIIFILMFSQLIRLKKFKSSCEIRTQWTWEVPRRVSPSQSTSLRLWVYHLLTSFTKTIYSSNSEEVQLLTMEPLPIFDLDGMDTTLISSPKNLFFLRSNPLSTQLLRWEELWTLVWRSQYKLEIIWMWHHSEGWDLNQPLLHRDGLPYLGLWHCCCSMGLKSPTCPARLSEKLASSVNMV